MRRLALGALSAFTLAVACAPIVADPPTDAPTNSGCPEQNSCDGYVVEGAPTRAQCNLGRCVFGRPDYAYTIVVDVPQSSYYAPGRSFVLTNKDLVTQPGLVTPLSCKLPGCVQLPVLVAATGKYRVTAAAAKAVGFPLEEGTSLPVRVSLFPLADGTSLNEAAPQGIPAAALFTSSQAIRQTSQAPTEVTYLDALSAGRYLRVAYPEPPFDQFFPPAIGALTEREGFFDDFILGDVKTPLDDDTGDLRRATITRAEGLDGWRAWLIDSATQRRISSIRTLKGTKTEARLDTVGQSQASSRALKDAVEVIVAPPAGFLGVPSLQSRIINGQGLEAVDVPSFPGPTPVSGVVASGDASALTGIPARLLFTSVRLRRTDSNLDELLRYTTTVSTDDAGRFKTVLPPGAYDVLVDPLEGTGFARVKDSFDTNALLGKTYRPPLRTIASGRAVLADGRPLAEADVFAVPSEKGVVGTAVKPRPARTRTDRTGLFAFEVDQGQYDLVVQPQGGTGFPWVVQARSVGTGTADIGDVVIPPPAPLALQFKDPSLNGNPIVRALVRVFAQPAGRGPPAVEIGRAMTDTDGKCEILLAPQPR